MNFFFNELTEMVKQVGIEKILHPEFTFINELVSEDLTLLKYIYISIFFKNYGFRFEYKNYYIISQ